MTVHAAKRMLIGSDKALFPIQPVRRLAIGPDFDLPGRVAIRCSNLLIERADLSLPGSVGIILSDACVRGRIIILFDFEVSL